MHTEEHKKKIAAIGKANLGRKQSDETREKKRLSSLGKKRGPYKVKEKTKDDIVVIDKPVVSILKKEIVKKKKTLSAEHKAKLSASRKGKKHGPYKSKHPNKPKAKWPILNRDLYDEMVLSKTNGELTKDTVAMVIIMADHLTEKFKYFNEEDREDVQSQALLEFLLYWKNFNPQYPNAFAYVTEILKQGLKKGWGRLHPVKYYNTVSTTNLYTI